MNKTKKFYFIFFALIISQNFFAKSFTKSPVKSVDCFCCSRRNSPCSCPNNWCYDRRCYFQHFGKTFFQPRSQNTNTARRAVGYHNLQHQFGQDKFCCTFAITPEYSQSFKPYHIAEYFFGTDVLCFAGSMVTERASNDILADYFGLSPEFEGCIKFEPQIKSFLLDFDLLLEFKRGFYFQAYAPFVKTKWLMQMCENIEENGLNTNFPAGYMADEEVTPAVSCISKALKGNVTFGDVQEGIKFGKFCCTQETTKLADITFLLGWIFLNREKGYVGTSIQVTAPTGTRPKNIYIFEPVAGNGRHWELGLGFTGQVLIWEKDNDQTLHFHFDTNFSHLFGACQCRSFDFKCNRFASRYMLLKNFDLDGNYNGNLVPAINVTTLKCKVKVNFQMDLNIMFAYNNKDWEFDFGYNAWLKSHEKIRLIDTFPENRYAFKGIQDVSDLSANVTQSCATIYGNSFDKQDEVADETFPIFLKSSDIDICSAEVPKALTHKFYANLSHEWQKSNSNVTPYLGGGWQIEFESVRPRFQCPYKNTLNQWALWLKAGFAYN